MKSLSQTSIISHIFKPSSEIVVFRMLWEKIFSINHWSNHTPGKGAGVQAVSVESLRRTISNLRGGTCPSWTSWLPHNAAKAEELKQGRGESQLLPKLPPLVASSLSFTSVQMADAFRPFMSASVPQAYGFLAFKRYWQNILKLLLWATNVTVY